MTPNIALIIATTAGFFGFCGGALWEYARKGGHHNTTKALERSRSALAVANRHIRDCTRESA